MALTPENSQKLTDLRSRMLRNVQQGKPSFEGITEDELKEGLSFLRQTRAVSSEKREKISKAAKKDKKPLAQVDLAGFTDVDLD